jgi:methylenetetrahydrofolate dehydrogenase (NADP+)/methenyltetrahydrofolate cyclohydrolase|tara:strand:- start:2270 stop:3085 length:816 start_codon:yes stop_codon:yes gene_type:complete
MIINGKEIASDIVSSVKEGVSKLGTKPRLVVFTVNPDLPTRKFLEIKKRVGSDVGVEVIENEVSPDIDTDTLVRKVEETSQESDGIIVQLPLPAQIDSEKVRDAIPITHDVDVLSDKAYELFKKGESKVLPPVVGAIDEIINKYNIDIKGKKVTVVGSGNLVGKPASVYFENSGGIVRVVDKDTDDISQATLEADILVLGAGVPGLIKPDMIKEGVAILDAGTSEAGGKLSGDADPECSEKAGLFTPVPGGIGPIAVSIIFKNLLDLTQGS